MKDSFRRVMKGSGASGLGLLARTAEQLLMVPILLSAWSVELYGEWLMIVAIPVYLSMSDLGFVTTGSNELARRAQNGVTDAVRNFYSDYMSFFARWSLVLFALITLAIQSLPISGLLNLHTMTEQSARWVLVLMVGAALVSQNSLTTLAGLRAVRKFHVGLMVKALISFLRIALLLVLVLVFKAGPVAVAALTLATSLLDFFIEAAILARNGIPARWHILRRAQEPMLPLLKGGLEMMLLPLSQALQLQGMTLLIGFTLGPVAVSIFNTHRTLSRLAMQLSQLGSNPLVAEMGILHSAESTAQVRDLLVRVARLTLWASLLAAGFLFLAGRMLFVTWTGDAIAFQPTLFSLLVGATVFEGIWRTSGAIRLGTNRHRPMVWGYLFISVTCLVLAWLLSARVGLIGAGLAVLLAEAAMNIRVILLNRELIRMGVLSYILAILQPPVAEIRKTVHLLRNRFLR